MAHLILIGRSHTLFQSNSFRLLQGKVGGKVEGVWRRAMRGGGTRKTHWFHNSFWENLPSTQNKVEGLMLDSCSYTITEHPSTIITFTTNSFRCLDDASPQVVFVAIVVSEMSFLLEEITILEDLHTI